MAPRRPPGPAGFGTARTLVLGLARVLSAGLSASSAAAAPLLTAREHNDGDDPDGDAGSLVVLYVASAVLVLLGGAFAGLTIALMGQDSIYLQVLSRDDTEPQQKNARRVHDLLQKGKHWVLVTLLLSNVIVNETLPVVLDRCLGGGVAAVVGSTLLIVVFGEVLPQSICVRYGLPIGGIMAKPVLALMWLMAPIAWPTAKVLDHALGEDHGTVYRKSGLKTLVTLHRSLGEVSERLNQDEVTIISAVLDLKEKPVSSVMTPMDDVFTMSEDTVLDEPTMDTILSAGYSRIPIHEPDNPTNFVGMLLVKILITYDPDDKMRVREFPLATLPETRPETSCLDIVNFFQEGKSHMVLVSQYPGEDHGALGVVTLEDVIEELIGEEIIDESDVYIDVHKAIRRLQPAPRARPMPRRTGTAIGALGRRGTASTSATRDAGEGEYDAGGHGPGHDHDPDRDHDHDHDERGTPSLHPPTVQDLRALSKEDARALSTSPKMTTVMMRRYSAGTDGRVTRSTVPVRANIDEMWQHLRHLGPSNRANNPKNTRLASVKIKQGQGQGQGPGPGPGQAHGTALGGVGAGAGAGVSQPASTALEPQAVVGVETDDDVDAGETTLLLGPPKKAPGDGGRGQAKNGYGSTQSDAAAAHADAHAQSPTAVLPVDIPAAEATPPHHSSSSVASKGSRSGWRGGPARSSSESSPTHRGGLLVSVAAAAAGELPAAHAVAHSPVSHRSLVRSGSITENVVETRGIRKVVLETTSSAEDDEDGNGNGNGNGNGHAGAVASTAAALATVAASLPHGHSPLRSSGAHSPAAPASGTHTPDADAAVEPGVVVSSSGGPVESPADDQADGAADDDGDGNANANGGSSSSAPKKKNRRKKRKAGK